uniref:Disease resistance R13L4/SHOC-2-like LRR domain-containing protein n=1 Tax=Quercus lobata TaxID=97700 RepID=A0A7N2N8J8_QUELO
MSLLAIGSEDDFRFIGIWGMGGIGKTHLARVVYDKVFNEFQGGCFIANVMSESEKCGSIRSARKVSDSKWFGSGSRVIITTKDRHLLGRHEVHEIYEAQGLKYIEALRLFSLKAFKERDPPKGYLDFSTSFVDYAKGLPLAISVLGSLLYNRSKKEYEEPEKWSKLWLYKDIRSMLMKNMEMEAIEGLVFQLGEQHKSEKAHWNLEAFPKMPNLKLLIIHDQLLHGPKHLSNNLRFLDWSGYPSKSLSSNCQPFELVELHELHGKIEWLWKGTKYLDKLKLIKLNNSLNLIATPDFAEVPNLEKLVLNGCINLHEVHPSIMVHKRLTLLDLKNCKSLRSLPNKFEMESLQTLILFGCSKVKRILEFMGNMKRLSKLHLEETAITKLPSLIEHLTNLDSLHLRDCKNLVCLPSIFCSFKSLKDINLAGCSKLDGLLEKLWNFESLEKLSACGITLREPPSFVVMLENLKELSLQGCKGPPHKLWNNLFPLNLMPRRSLNPVSLLLPSILVYEQDMEDIREMLSTQSSNNTCITPYEGLDVHHNSIEGIKLKRSHDEYEGAGASGQGSTNDVPHSKRIER